MKIRQVLAAAALVVGLSTASVAKADTCSTQAVVAGFSCTLNDLTFTFTTVSFSNGTGLLNLEQPSTGFAGGVATLDFQVNSATPVDIHLIYDVTTNPVNSEITNLDSGFTQGNGTPPGNIVETGCRVDPTIGGCSPANTLVTYTNTGGPLTSPGFGPVSSLWVDKDITDNGFSTFMDSVHETTTPTPEPSSIALFGTGLLAAAGMGRRRLKA
jgi:hypothetical protein